MNGPALAKCIADPATAKRLERDTADATAAGATGTPTTIVRNNRTGAGEALIGVVPADVMAQKIDRLLATQSPASTKAVK